VASTDFNAAMTKLGIDRTSSATAVQSFKSASLGQGDFLKLMTAQMKNQDPFDPVDNTQMVAQMAQFSSLAGISEMGTTLKAIATRLGATSASDAASYIGRTVLTEGATAYPRTGGGLAGAVELDKAADDVTVSITDANGQLVHTASLGKRDAGTATFDWDGVADTGAADHAGPYTVAATARAAGKSLATRTLVWAPVESVSNPASGDPVLTVSGLGPVKLSAVRSVG
jgi:flagellar basal-body rod modification protein FlgD